MAIRCFLGFKRKNLGNKKTQLISGFGLFLASIEIHECHSITEHNNHN